MFTLFLSSDAEIDLPPVLEARVYRPDRVRDPFLDDGAPPAWVAQLYFDSLAALEAAAAQMRGPADAEAMQVHRFAVALPGGPAAGAASAAEQGGLRQRRRARGRARFTGAA